MPETRAATVKNRKPIARSKKRIPRYAELPPPTKLIRSRKADPAKRRFAKHRCDSYREWLKLQPCCVTGMRTGQRLIKMVTYSWGSTEVMFDIIVDPAHLIPRGRGADDLNNCVSLARHLHNEQEKRTDEFNAKYKVNLWEIAKQQTEEWLATADGEAWQREHGEVPDGA